MPHLEDAKVVVRLGDIWIKFNGSEEVELGPLKVLEHIPKDDDS